jgi:oligosaccharide repeat unit polymerase
MTYVFSLSLCLIISILIFLTDSFESLNMVVDIVLVTLLILKIYFYRKIKVDFFYIVYIGFLFLIYFDINNPPLKFDKDVELEACKIIASCFFILLSTLLIQKPIKKKGGLNNTEIVKVTTRQKLFLISIYILYMFVMTQTAIVGFYYGRNSGMLASWIGPFYKYFVAISYVLPGLFAYLFVKKNITFTLLLILTLPIFGIQILNGTRFVFLFSFFIFACFIFDINNLNKKNILILFVLFIGASSLITTIRSGGVVNESPTDKKLIDNILHSEGLVYYFSGLVKYYEHNEHSYLPIQSSFVTYFYIPRSLWPEKPKLIGKWILHSGVFSESFSDKHSGSVTIVGPFYADFGYFCFLIIFILGRGLSKVEQLYFAYISRKDLTTIIAASTAPTLFFSLRSFNTSFITFAVICFFTLIFVLLGRTGIFRKR